MNIIQVFDPPKFVKDIDPGVPFYMTCKAEKSLVWKGIEEGTEYPYLVFSTPFMDSSPFELLDATHSMSRLEFPVVMHCCYRSPIHSNLLGRSSVMPPDGTCSRK